MKKKFKLGQAIVYTIMFIIFALHAFSLIFSISWGFLSSLKTQKEFSINPPLAFPEMWIFKNYVTAFNALEVKGFNLWGLIGNSLWFAAGTPLMQVTISMIQSYVVVKYSCKFTKFEHEWRMFNLLVNISGGAAPFYRFISTLGWTNSPLFLLARLGGSTFAYLIFYACWKGVANDYIEAAKIDGADHWTIMFKVMIPQVMGTWGALFIMDFIVQWNDAQTSMIYFPDWPTLATGLFEYQDNMIRQINMPVYFAGLIIAMIPVLILFIFFQDTIMEKVNIGGIKG